MPPTPAVHWKVVNSAISTGANAQGNFVPGRNVTAQLDDGATFTVFIPNSVADINAVQAMIAAEATRIAAIHRLQV